jgi:hypothetical protein
MGAESSGWKETNGSTDYLKGKNVDQGKPPPRLAWSTGDYFYWNTEGVLRFLEDSLELSLVEDWKLQRAAFRDLIRWFFLGRRGPAWVSTIPFKPFSGVAVRTLSTDSKDSRHLPNLKQERPVTQLEPSGDPDHDGNIRGVAAVFDGDLPKFSLNGMLFAYGKTEKISKNTHLLRQSRRNLLVSDGIDLRGSDVSYFLGRPEDRKLIWEAGGVTTARDFCDERQNLYMMPQIRFCRLPRFPVRLQDTADITTQLVIALRPDGRICELIRSSRSMGAYLRQQELDYQMLRNVEALSD